jgi:hypothetical protein
VERSFGEEPLLAAQPLRPPLITVAAIVTRTISIAVEAPTTVVEEFTAAAPQSSEAVLQFAVVPLFAEVARAPPAVN